MLCNFPSPTRAITAHGSLTPRPANYQRSSGSPLSCLRHGQSGASGATLWGRGGGDSNGPAVNAQIYHPYALAIDGAGNLYIADSYNYRIRRVVSGGTITTLTGNGSANYSGDGGPAGSAQLGLPTGAAVDSAGNVYIVDDGNGRVRVVNTQVSSITALGKTIAAGNIATVAGNGTRSYGGDGGVATVSKFLPIQVVVER